MHLEAVAHRASLGLGPVPCPTPPTPGPWSPNTKIPRSFCLRVLTPVLSCLTLRRFSPRCLPVIRSHSDVTPLPQKSSRTSQFKTALLTLPLLVAVGFIFFLEFVTV